MEDLKSIQEKDLTKLLIEILKRLKKTEAEILRIRKIIQGL